MKALIQKDACTPVFIAALFTTAQTWKQPKCPSTEEHKKNMWFTHTYTRTHSGKGFPGSSAGKESPCKAGDPSSIPGLGRSPGEGNGYPLQDSWASLVAQTVKNPPAMRETWVLSLGWKDPLEEGMATHSSILAWRIPMDRRDGRAKVHGVTKSRT